MLSSHSGLVISRDCLFIYAFISGGVGGGVETRAFPVLGKCSDISHGLVLIILLKVKMLRAQRVGCSAQMICVSSILS